MKQGQCKLCDVHCHLANAVGMRVDVERYLTSEKIPFDVYSHEGKDGGDYWRYAVPIAEVQRAKKGLPLALRGFRAVGEALHGGRH
jgi:hypothetical protein